MVFSLLRWNRLLLILLVNSLGLTTDAAEISGRQQATFARSGGVYASGSPDGVFGKLNAFRAHVDLDINERLQAGRDQDLINVVQLAYERHWAGDRDETQKKINEWLERTDLSLVDVVHLSEEQPYNAHKWLDPLYDAMKAYDATLPVYVWPTFPLGPMGKADGYVYDAYGEGYMASRRRLMGFLRTGKPLIMCVDASGFSDYRAAREQLMVCHELDIPVYYFVANNGSGSYNAWYGNATAALSACRNFMFSAMEFQRRCGDPDPISAGDFIWGEQIELAPNEKGEVDYTWSELGEATVYGFTKLTIKDQALRVAGDSEVAMDHQFWSPLPVKNAHLRLMVSEDAAPGAIQVEQSRCGKYDEWRPVEATHSANELVYNLGDLGREFRLRVTLGQGAVLQGGHLGGQSAVPADPAIDLDAHYDGWRKKILFRQDLGVGLWRSMARIDNPQHLRDDTSLSLRGKKGAGISVRVVEKFTSAQPLEKIMVRLSGKSHSALGGAFSLGVSLDGETIIEEGTAMGAPRADGLYEGTHVLDLSERPDFQGVQMFYVHLIQRNGSGLETNTSSNLDLLEIEATRVE